MSGSPVLQAFIADFANNPRAMREMGYQATDQRLALLQAEAALDNNHVWIEAEPQPGAWEQTRDHMKRGISNLHNDWIYNSPSRMVWDATRSEWIVSTYSGRIVVLDDNLSFKRYIGFVGNSAYSDKHNYYVNGIRVSPDGTRLAICNYSQHIVRVYDYQPDGDIIHLYDVGVLNGAGQPSAGRLQNPTDVAFLPNGNLAIISFQGNDTVGSYTSPGGTGVVSEHDIATGNFVRVLLFFSEGSNGEPWNNSGIYQPNSMEIVTNPNTGNPELWLSSQSQMSYNYRDWIAAFDISDLNLAPALPLVKAFREPVGWPFAYLAPQGFEVDYQNDRLIFTSWDNGVIGTIQISTSDLLHIYGTYDRQDYRGNLFTVRGHEDITNGGFFQPAGVRLIDQNTMAVDNVWIVDRGNNAIKPGYLPGTVEVPYNVSIPSGYHVSHGYEGFMGLDTTTGIRKVSANDLDSIGKVPVILERMYP